MSQQEDNLTHRCGHPVSANNTRWSLDGHGCRYKTCRTCAKLKLDKRRQMAKAYVQKIRATTVCRKCGRQPIEWHSEKHKNHQHRRVGAMAMAGLPIATIAAEIKRCVPLCRRCHMVNDGRMEIAITNVRTAPRPRGDRHWTRRRA